MSEVVTKEETLVGEPHEKPKTQYNYNSLERLGGELRINTKKEKEKKNIAKYNLGESAPFEDTSRIWNLPTNRKPSSSNEPKLLNEYILNQNENKDRYIHNEDALNAELHRSAKMVLIDSEEPLTARSSLSNDSQATWRFGNEEDRSEMESVTSNATGYSSNILFGAQSAYRRTVKKLKEAKLLLKQASKDEIDVGNAESEYFDQKSVKKWHQDEVELAGEKGVYSDNQKGMDGPKVYSHNYEEYNDQNYWNDSVSANHNYYENNGARGRGPNRDFAHENYWGIDEKTPAIRNRAIRGYNNQHEASRAYNSVGQRGEGGGSERDKQGVDYTYVSNGYYLKDNGDFVLARGGEDLDERDPRGRRGKEVAMAYPPYFRQQDDGVYRNGHEYWHGDGINSIENRTNAYKYDYDRRYMDSYDHHGPRDISTNQNWMHGSEYSIQREKNESSSLFLGYKAHKYVQISSQTRPTESRLGIVDQGNVISDKKTMYYGSGMFSKGVGFYTMLAATAGLSAANPVYSAKAFDRFIALLSVVGDICYDQGWTVGAFVIVV
ncbi:hypothetical protein AX774_g219 [Zancudomyces culisetae]|uniref:Uncharacterized protein n=1 Tax=Zancudomyces culisetae TaxID=1213189 RepID=A0A1R1PZ17_ZANCU|nr:hypothetical protein AX774_g219 [Zancudomyces culisetae]|eukprot:OMH86193.1 hypothetical protein AX774_g219 [Zancudomyces culisetae]